MHRLIVSLLLLVAFTGSATAAQIYWSPDPIEKSIDGVNQRLIASGTLVVAPDEHPGIEIEGLSRIDIPAGTTPYLIHLHSSQEDRDRVATKASLLRDLDDEFALMAVTDEQAIALDRKALHRERLIYIAPSAFAPRTQYRDAAAKVDAQTKSDIIDAVTESTIANYMRELSGDLVFYLDGILRATDNRNTHSVEHLIAADYIQDRLEAMGYTVFRQNFSVSGTPTQNIIAEKIGTTYPNEIVVVGGHYDSTSENTNNKAPGAEDNASGTAAVMHLAEVFADYDTERTIHFIAFGGEEQGLHGSQYYVQQAGINGDNITESLTMDMIASWQSNFKVIIEGEAPWASLMELYEDNLVALGEIGYRKDWNSWGSDHVPFQQAGIPCFLAIDWDYGAYPDYHRTTDVFSSTDPALAHAIVRAMAGAMADLTNPTPTATPVRQPVSRELVRLVQNHPNPFNPSTTIAFELDQAATVRLDVFDPAGRHITSLAHRDYDAGRHEVQWAGRDASGSPVASGVYIYRLQSGDTVLSQRMVLAK